MIDIFNMRLLHRKAIDVGPDMVIYMTPFQSGFCCDYFGSFALILLIVPQYGHLLALGHGLSLRMQFAQKYLPQASQ